MFDLIVVKDYNDFHRSLVYINIDKIVCIKKLPYTNTYIIYTVNEQIQIGKYEFECIKPILEYYLIT